MEVLDDTRNYVGCGLIERRRNLNTIMLAATEWASKGLWSEAHFELPSVPGLIRGAAQTCRT